MPAVNIGASAVTGIYKGSVAVQNAYKGSVMVWQRSNIFDDFNRNDSGTLGSNWMNYDSADYNIGISSGTAQVQIPDGIIGGQYSLNSPQVRFTLHDAPGDDGYVEVGVASQGDSKSLTSTSGYVTDVWHRLDSGVPVTHGPRTYQSAVGIRLTAGQCSIVAKVGGADNVQVGCGSFQAGDIMRLIAVGNTHTLYRNGGRVGQWNDSGSTVPKGSAFRSMGIRADGAKDTLGPRRFSPALDYIVMG